MIKNFKTEISVKKFISLLVCAIIFVSVFFTGCTTDTKSWVLKTIKSNYLFYDDLDLDGAEDLSLNEIVSKLDIYSEYYTSEEYDAEISDNGGSKSGVGLYTNFIEGKGVYVAKVVGNSPANEAGITVGDIFVSGTRGGETVLFTSAGSFAGFVSSNAEGEKFTLSTADKDFTLSREEYTASYAYMATCDTAWEFTSSADGGLALVENPHKARGYLPEDSAYINILQFFGTAGGETGALLAKFNAENKKTLFLDLRNNGGGYVSVMQDIAGYFTSSVSSEASAAMTAEYRSGKKELWNASVHTGSSLVSKDTKIYVLANSGTASASEALIGVLVSYGFLDYENIFISDFSEEYLNWAGEGEKTAQTYGKGIMQSTFRRFTGEALKLTTALIKWPNGKCIHEVALSAKDGCTIVPAEWTATKNDEELRRVVRIINER